MVTQTDLNAAVLAASTSAADAATFAREAEEAATTTQTNQVTITTLVNSALTCENNASYDAGQAKGSAEAAEDARRSAAISAQDAALAASTATTQAGLATSEADRAKSEADRAAGTANTISLPIDGGTDIARSSISMDRLAFSIDTHVGNANYTNINTTQINGRDIEPERVKSWVSYNGVSNYVETSLNVTSVTDNGTGNFTINFASPFSSNRYSLSGTCDAYNNNDGTSINPITESPPTTGAVSFYVKPGSSIIEVDREFNSVCIHGDLA